MGLRCLFKSVTGFCFGSGKTFASFQEDESFCSLIVLLSTARIGSARTTAYSFNNQFSTPSGPEALCGLSFCIEINIQLLR